MRPAVSQENNPNYRQKSRMMLEAQAAEGLTGLPYHDHLEAAASCADRH